MTWWTASANLTPVAAWDAARTNANQMLDGVGSNHISRPNGTSTYDFLALGVAGDSNPMALTTPVTVPTTGVVAALWRISRRNVLLSRVFGGTDGYMLHQNESDRNWYATASSAGAVYFTDTRWRVGELTFAAVYNDGTVSRLYLDGGFVGDTVSLARIPAQIATVGYGGNGNEYNLDSDEFLSGLGFWTGTATVADIAAIEVALRAALPGQQATARGLPLRNGRRQGEYSPNYINAHLQLPAFNFGRGRHTIPGLQTGLTSSIGGGLGQITGTIAEVGVPANQPLSRKVVLIDEITGICAGSMWSDPQTGAYRFYHLNMGRKFTVVAYDYQNLYRAVIADNLTPEPMP